MGWIQPNPVPKIAVHMAHRFFVPRLFDVCYRYWRGGLFCEFAIEECHNFASKMVFLGSTWKPVTIPASFGMSESFSVPYDTILQLFWRKVSPDRGIFPAFKL